VVAWGEACLRRGASQEDSLAMLDASCRADDSARIALLEQHGFVRQEFRALKFYRPLDELVPAPQAPPGFRISHAAGEQEVEALVALHRAAFGTQNMTVEERLAMMRQPGYDPALDLLVRAPDGRLAAYCFCSVSLEENRRSGRKEGCTDPVATHPDFQRRGLGLALLLTGLHALKQRGMQAAVLGTGSDNFAMQRLAQAAGFRVRSTTLWFSKRVPPEG
jgi:ribosomal protein S18 acetylase RimI-like enzyme